MGGEIGELLQIARYFICACVVGAVVEKSEARGEEVGESLVEGRGVGGQTDENLEAKSKKGSIFLIDD